MFQFTLANVVKTLARIISGHFEALNFEQGKLKGQKFKTCYLRLSEKLDPVRVVERINNSGKTLKSFRLCSFVPKRVPDVSSVNLVFRMLVYHENLEF